MMQNRQIGYCFEFTCPPKRARLTRNGANDKVVQECFWANKVRRRACYRRNIDFGGRRRIHISYERGARRGRLERKLEGLVRFKFYINNNNNNSKGMEIYDTPFAVFRSYTVLSVLDNVKP